jgi:hypothetical protein
MPTHLVAELNRLRRRLSLTLEMIRELDAVREQALKEQHDSASRTVKALCTIRGIGVNFASILTREVFYRTFDNRRQIASYLGLAPTPFQSGGMDRDRRINRAGNSRARKTIVQLAWLWLRYQPESSHAAWFRDRVGSLQGRIRRITIVALARKLLIAIWRFVTLGHNRFSGPFREIRKLLDANAIGRVSHVQAELMARWCRAPPSRPGAAKPGRATVFNRGASRSSSGPTTLRNLRIAYTVGLRRSIRFPIFIAARETRRRASSGLAAR